MRRAGGSQQAQAESRRAADRLQEAQDLLRGMRGDQASQQLDDLTRRADRLADQQQDFDKRVRQAFGQSKTTVPTDQARQMADERDKQLEELNRLQQQMQQAARDMAGSQRAASSRLRSALGEAQQNELTTRMRYNSELLRRGYGQYVPLREAPITQGLNQLRDQLRGAEGSLDRNNRPGQGGQQQALGQIEQLRNRLQGLAGRPNAAGLYEQGLRDLAALGRSLQGNPEIARDIQQLLAEMQRLDASRFAAQLLPALEQIELQLRRQLDEQQGGQVRDAGSEPVPPGYSGAVADYFRRLSQGR
jgi:ribosomal protein L22